MTGADLLVRCLEREGVEYVFGVPGEETLDLNNALADSTIRFIPTRHEQGAAFMAKGILPADHPQALMTVGLGRGDAERAGFLEADLVIAAGYDPVEWGPRTWNPRRQAQIVHLDFTSAEVDAHYDPAVEVVADVREALELLAALVAPGDRQPPAKARRDDRCRSDAFPLLPERVLADLEAALAPSDLVISDVGAHKLWVAKHYGARLPNTVIISNGFAAMGIGLPGAIAAKLVFPERRVVTVTGDGGFLMNVQEMETAMRLGLPLVVLIFRDDGYGSIRWKQVQGFQPTAGVGYLAAPAAVARYDERRSPRRQWYGDAH